MSTRTLVLGLGISLGLSLAGCANQVDVGHSAGTSSTSAGPVFTTGGVEVDAMVRLANLGPYFSPLDLCVGTLGANGKPIFPPGPALAALGRTKGIANAQVSTYVPAKTGNIVRVVAAGTACNPGWGVHTSQDVQLPGPSDKSHLGPRFTIVPVPGASPAETEFRLFVDEPENDQYGIHVRVIQALPDSPPSAVTVIADNGFGEVETWFDNLPYAEAPDHSPLGKVSVNGFLWRPQIELAKIRVVQDGEAVAEQQEAFAVPSGDGNAYGVASVFVSTTGPYAKPTIIACGDNAKGEDGLGACSAP